jgi:hypothetical protein
MPRPEWLDWSYDDAMKMVAERAVYSRSVGGLVKQGDLSNLFGLLGGGGGPAPGGPTPQQVTSAIQSSQAARQQLGIQGADEAKINQGVAALRSGTADPSQVAAHMRTAMPSRLAQFRQSVPAFGTAMSQGNLGEAANQLDVLGLKNYNPFGRHFSPTTTLAAAGLHGLTRFGPQMARQFEGLQDYVSPQGLMRMGVNRLTPGGSAHKWLNVARQSALDRYILSGGAGANKDLLKNLNKAQRKALAAVSGASGGLPNIDAAARNKIENAMIAGGASGGGLFNKVTGGVMPSLAALAPGMIREWLLPGGYRSGKRPIMDIIEANKVLNASRR